MNELIQKLKQRFNEISNNTQNAIEVFQRPEVVDFLHLDQLSPQNLMNQAIGNWKTYYLPRLQGRARWTPMERGESPKEFIDKLISTFKGKK